MSCSFLLPCIQKKAPVELFLVVKNLPNVDILAEADDWGYDTCTTIFKEELRMRHVYIRSMLSLIWFVTAIVCGISGNLEMAVLYVGIGLGFLYSAYAMWKKEKDGKGEK
jgi:hypothetical protein